MAKLNYTTRAGGACREARGWAARCRLWALPQRRMRNEPISGRKSLVCSAVRRNHEPKRTQETQGGGTGSSRGGQRGPATRDVLLWKTCLPTIIVPDVARAVAVKCFVYNEKSCEMGFPGRAFSQNPVGQSGGVANQEHRRRLPNGRIRDGNSSRPCGCSRSPSARWCRQPTASPPGLLHRSSRSGCGPAPRNSSKAT